jgi:hypothetical protein
VWVQVYLGPSLDGLREGQLPHAFEAEHRSCPHRNLDLLQIVSGPTLLGSVRCYTSPVLPAEATSRGLLESPRERERHQPCASSTAFLQDPTDIRVNLHRGWTDALLASSSTLGTMLRL